MNTCNLVCLRFPDLLQYSTPVLTPYSADSMCTGIEQVPPLHSCRQCMDCGKGLWITFYTCQMLSARCFDHFDLVPIQARSDF